jgi:hypothetical protein
MYCQEMKPREKILISAVVQLSDGFLTNIQHIVSEKFLMIFPTNDCLTTVMLSQLDCSNC